MIEHSRIGSSCPVATCSHAQQYWPVWVCAISSGGALVSKGLYDRWDFAGGFVAAGVIVSLAISCFRKQDRPLTPNTIREGRQVIVQNHEDLEGALGDQYLVNQQLEEGRRNLAAGQAGVQEMITRQDSGGRHLDDAVNQQIQDQEALARIAEQQQANQNAAQNLAERGEQAVQEQGDANGFLAAAIAGAKAILNKENQVLPFVEEDL